MISSLLVAAFLLQGIVICLRKWNIIPAYELHKKRWMPDWCTFCFGFWGGCAIIGFSYELTLLTDTPLVIAYGLVIAAMLSLIERLTS